MFERAKHFLTSA